MGEGARRDESAVLAGRAGSTAGRETSVDGERGRGLGRLREAEGERTGNRGTCMMRGCGQMAVGTRCKPRQLPGEAGFPSLCPQLLGQDSPSNSLESVNMSASPSKLNVLRSETRLTQLCAPVLSLVPAHGKCQKPLWEEGTAAGLGGWVPGKPHPFPGPHFPLCTHE